MAKTIKEAALDYIESGRECNLYAANHKLTLSVGNTVVDVESIWHNNAEDKVYLHVGCKEFEGDIDIESLSDKNQERLRKVLMCVSLSPSEVRNLTEQWKHEPIVFLFRVADVEREEVDRGMSRKECFERCANYYLLSELGDAWNDTDDDGQQVLEVRDTWCYVSRPERKEEPWQFDELAFIEKYCPMEGGNDYLGYIDDICKLLDGEAEPGDAASTGEYADYSEDELRKELKRLTKIVLEQAVERYVNEKY